MGPTLRSPTRGVGKRCSARTSSSRQLRVGRRPSLTAPAARPASGKLMRTIMAGLAEYERDLIRERVKSGLASARARGVLRGRQEGQCPSDKKANKVLAQHKQGLSYRLIGRNLGLSKNTAMEIVKRSAG